ncbi:indoleamine 2,3-dioxygenase 2-like [Garra rufa]|uniref:indoleamine 2,3-dioxygenase 2-like n=1 Tax=Garra rufa TaxID=137080 RepID=UPI003CCE7C2F
MSEIELLKEENLFEAAASPTSPAVTQANAVPQDPPSEPAAAKRGRKPSRSTIHARRTPPSPSPSRHQPPSPASSFASALSSIPATGNIKMPLLETHLLQTHRELRLAYLALSMMTVGYVWQEGERETIKVLSHSLSVPFCEVSDRLGLPPILIYADAVLANWKKRDSDSSCPGGWSQTILEVKMLDVEVLGWCGYTWSVVVRPVGSPEASSDHESAAPVPPEVAAPAAEPSKEAAFMAEPPKRTLLLTFPGGESVREFFMVSLLVELARFLFSQSILDVINGIHDNDVSMVTKALDVVSQTIDSMKQTLKLMHEYVDPSIIYGIMRIYLSGWKDNLLMPDGLMYEGVQEKPMEFSGSSAAQSSILHCFDELLGVQHEGSSGAFLRRMRDYMLPSHKHFIENISSRSSLRMFVLQQGDERLTHIFEQCVARLVDFRNYHITIVTRYITIPASRAKQLRANKQDLAEELDTIRKAPTALEERGTGGSGIMTFLKTVRDKTQAHHTRKLLLHLL